VKETSVKNVLKDTAQKAPKSAKGDAVDLKAIRVAIEFEGKGAEYYARLLDEVSDPKEKAFFNLLANIEHEHYVSLKETEEFLTDPVSWFRKTEHTHVDGA
jgi:rubrerythrin